METITRAARRGRRVAPSRPSRFGRASPSSSQRHDPLIVSSGFHELIEPVLEREGVDVRVVANRLDAAARRLARALPATGGLRGLRRAVQALRRRGASTASSTSATASPTAASRRRRAGLRPRRPRDLPRRERRGVRAVRRLLRRRERARRRRRRAAHAQPRPEDVARLPFGRPRNLTPERLDGRARDLVDRLLDRRERRVRPGRGVDAVEAHDGELAGTSRPRSPASCSAPMAMRSLEQITAVGRSASGFARSSRSASRPPPTVNEECATSPSVS